MCIRDRNCSQMTAAEVENLFKQKFENYTIEVSARDQAPQTISGADISYQYLSTGEVLKLLKMCIRDRSSTADL